MLQTNSLNDTVHWLEYIIPSEFRLFSFPFSTSRYSFVFFLFFALCSFLSRKCNFNLNNFRDTNKKTVGWILLERKRQGAAESRNFWTLSVWKVILNVRVNQKRGQRRSIMWGDAETEEKSICMKTTEWNRMGKNKQVNAFVCVRCLHEVAV